MAKPACALRFRSFRPVLEGLEERVVPSGLPGDLIAAGRVLLPAAGQAFNGTVANFTDPDGAGTQGSFSAAVDWGDGQTSAAQVTAGDDGLYRVAASHTYASAGLFRYSVHVTDSDGDADTAHGRAVVGGTGNDLAAEGKVILAAAGQPFSGRVAFVSDPDLSSPIGVLSATINWGDGQTSAGQVTLGDDGTADVTGTHTYAVARLYQYSVQVADTDGDQASTQGLALIGPPGGDLLSVGRAIRPTAGQAFSGPVAFGIDPDVDVTPGTLTASIDWGDGQTSAGQVSVASEGGFSVAGTHTYASTGAFTYTVQLNDTDGDGDTTHGKALVGADQGDLEAAGKRIVVGAGQTFNGRLAIVTDADPSNPQGTLAATIDWGDGQTSAGQLTSNNDGTWTLAGTHTYAQPGVFFYSAKVRDSDGDSDTARGLALVTPAGGDLLALGQVIAPNAGKAFNGRVASFVDPDLGNPQGNFTATIDWGDGQTSAGQVTAAGARFKVTGTHTYAGDGEYQYTVQITDGDGDSDIAHGRALVDTDEGDLTAAGRSLVMDAGASFEGRVAFFTDADPSNTPGSFTASVDWGDGQTSTGQVTAGNDGFYRVTASHTYATPGRFHYSVKVSDSDGDSDTAFGRALVQAPQGRLALAGKGSAAVAVVVTANGDLFWHAGAAWVRLGSFIQSVSATADSGGNPVLFVVTLHHDLLRFDSAHGWQSLGGFIDSVSGTTDAAGNQVVFAVTTGHSLFRLDGGGWSLLGNFIASASITPGSDGNPVIFAVTTGHALFRLDAQGWALAGAFVDSASATTDNAGNAVVFVLTSAHDLFRMDHRGWSKVGSFIDGLSAGTDELGQAEVEVVTATGDVYRNDRLGKWTPLDPPAALQSLAAAAADQVFALAANGTVLEFRAAGGWQSLGKPG